MFLESNATLNQLESKANAMRYYSYTQLVDTIVYSRNRVLVDAARYEKYRRGY